MKLQNLFEFFEVPDPPEQLFWSLRSVTVDRADCFPAWQLLKVYVSSDRLISSARLNEAEDLIAAQRFPEQGVRVRIIPRFQLERTLTALEALELYHENIVWELYNQNRDIPLLLLYRNAAIQQTEKGLVLTLDNPFMAELRGDALRAYVQTLLSERFGIEIPVVTQVYEDPEVKQ